MTKLNRLHSARGLKLSTMQKLKRADLPPGKAVA
jgi:hypothetical protein